MIITISGALGSGKSTVAKMLAEIIGFKHYSTGDFMRELAVKKGVTFAQLNEIAKTDPSVDKEIDEQTKIIGEKGDDFIIDSRMGFHFLPNSVKIYLDVKEEEAAHRIYLAKRQDEPNRTERDVLKFLKQRKASEIERYIKTYGINCHNISKEKHHYDFVINTTGKDIGEVLDAVLLAIYREGRLPRKYLGQGSEKYDAMNEAKEEPQTAPGKKEEEKYGPGEDIQT
jgi:cytidylate kinase